jgi:hypothetical protein
MPAPPQPLPVSRLVANLTDYIAKNPDDVKAIYTLGRVHYFAFAGATDTLNTYGSSTAAVPSLSDFGISGTKTAVSRSTAPVFEAARLAHLQEALTHLTRAASSSKTTGADDGRYVLSLACAFEDGAPFAERMPARNGVAASGQAWRDVALRYYAVAFDRAVTRDNSTHSQPIWGLDMLVSYEAGRSYERLLATSGTLTREQRSRLARIKQSASTLARLPHGPVTPLIFTFDDDVNFEQLMSDRAVDFDLDGTHLPQRYRWLTPNAALLVWDPEGTGRVTSGRQLFGAVTWWMFWDDAYKALAALDDDASGWLEGQELGGLAVWFDRNQDGVSGDGEVMPIAGTPIIAIAAHASGKTGSTVMNARGLRLRDGRVLPTYDWIAQPALQSQRRTTDSQIR